MLEPLRVALHVRSDALVTMAAAELDPLCEGLAVAIISVRGSVDREGQVDGAAEHRSQGVEASGKARLGAEEGGDGDVRVEVDAVAEDGHELARLDQVADAKDGGDIPRRQLDEATDRAWVD